jgi:hypothetical protein
MLTKPEDRQALELMAIGWEKTADEREATLRSQPNPEQSAGTYEATRGFRCAIEAERSGHDQYPWAAVFAWHFRELGS